MRQIKFRGQRTDNGEWEYGDLIHCKGITQTGLRDKVCIGNKEVIPETVGQFTGLYDATKWENLTEDERKKWTLDGNMPSEWKGREIYEDDTVKWTDANKNERIDTVCWKNGGMILCDITYFMGIYSFYGFKVIGNLHDNKDLLIIK
jgi:hypothetical protein